MRVHQGPIDEDMVTSDLSSIEVVHALLIVRGVRLQQISPFWHRCTRPTRMAVAQDVVYSDTLYGRDTLYEDPEENDSDEVRSCSRS